MFTDFFYYLKNSGVPVSLNEWDTLMEALEKNLAYSSLTGFYRLCRAVLVKNEAYFDRFDMAFAGYFAHIETPDELPEEIFKWLDKNLPPKEITEQMRLNHMSLDLETLKKMLEERIKEQKEEHHGGSYWIGTGGTSPFGHSGYHPGGFRIGGSSRGLSAVKVAGMRKYREFRTDETIGIRQFQTALKKLRLLSDKTYGEKTELNLDKTIDRTCKNAGMLELAFDRPKENKIKVLVLADSGGSMAYYADICDRLFTALNKSDHFKDLKIYYFHNCIYDELYTDSYLRRKSAVSFESFMNNVGSDYRVFLVGDAAMSPYELMSPGGIIDWGLYNEVPGIERLRDIRKKFDYAVWLNPILKQNRNYNDGYFTISRIAEIFPMEDLTGEGLEKAVKILKSKKFA